MERRYMGPEAGSSAAGTAAATLEAEIGRLTQRGFVIVSRSETSAQLRRPKHFSVGWALVWLVVGLGAGLALYVAWYVLIKRDQVVFLRITPDGRVLRTSN
jgi:hypothetical protein